MHVPESMRMSSVGALRALHRTAPRLCVWSVAIAASALTGVRLRVSCGEARAAHKQYQFLTGAYLHGYLYLKTNPS